MIQQISCRLPDELYELLRQEAFNRRTTMNEIACDGIRLRLAHLNGTLTEETAAIEARDKEAQKKKAGKHT